MDGANMNSLSQKLEVFDGGNTDFGRVIPAPGSEALPMPGRDASVEAKKMIGSVAAEKGIFSPEEVVGNFEQSEMETSEVESDVVKMTPETEENVISTTPGRAENSVFDAEGQANLKEMRTSKNGLNNAGLKVINGMLGRFKKKDGEPADLKAARDEAMVINLRQSYADRQDFMSGKKAA